jgi:hypothetical protein
MSTSMLVKWLILLWREHFFCRFILSSQIDGDEPRPATGMVQSYLTISLTAMDSGGIGIPCACTFWVGTYPWREYNLGESSQFLSPYIHGNFK